MQLTQAFPKDLHYKVSELPFKFSAYETFFSVQLNGEKLQIPYRIYNEELPTKAFDALDFQGKMIISCLYTRHHDGFVRQKYTEILLAHLLDETWMLPYIVKLVGEYIVEIVEIIYLHKSRIPTAALRQFYMENKAFIHLTRDRMISYWDVYYRNQFPIVKQYSGEKLFQYFKRVALNPSFNMLALEHYEKNKMAESFKQFEKALKQKRTVQALHNLAWMYVYEEESPELAKPLLLEALSQQPKHHFPYSQLGEIYVNEKAFEKAIPYLEQALSLTPSDEAKHNLAVALFELGQYEKAAGYFSETAGEADLVRLNIAVCYMRLGQMDRAKQQLDLFNLKADDFVGYSELADVYVELCEYEKAYEFFKIDWEDESIFSNYLFIRIAFVMYCLQAFKELEAFLERGKEILLSFIQELKEEQYSEPLDIEHAKEVLEEYEQQLAEMNLLYEQLKEGYIPSFQFEVFAEGGCKLYGCIRHGHAEYEMNDIL